jgi:hypothetical protein
MLIWLCVMGLLLQSVIGTRKLYEQVEVSMKIFVPICDDDLSSMKNINPNMLVPYNQDYTIEHRLNDRRPAYNNDLKKIRRFP